jgi:hypothetical protein
VTPERRETSPPQHECSAATWGSFGCSAQDDNSNAGRQFPKTLTTRRSQRRHLKEIAHAGVYHFSAARDHSLAKDFVLHIQL